MLPAIQMFGRLIPSYSLMGILGGVLALGVIALRCRRTPGQTENAIYVFVLGVVGAMIGAKVLYLLTVLPDFLRDLPTLFTAPNLFLSKYLSGGLVFYGGLIGGAAAAALTARSYGITLRSLTPALLPAVALLSGFGRIGCFLAGCCYGVPTSCPLGVTFPSGSIAPSGQPLLPVQLFEAGFDFLLFSLMLWATRHPSLSCWSVRLYALLYAAMRFTLEFLRGDAVRGSWAGLTTSQWISVLLVLGVVILSVLERRWPARTKSPE